MKPEVGPPMRIIPFSLKRVFLRTTNARIAELVSGPTVLNGPASSEDRQGRPAALNCLLIPNSCPSYFEPVETSVQHLASDQALSSHNMETGLPSAARIEQARSPIPPVPFFGETPGTRCGCCAK
jgi:hypothetical protein